MKIFYVLSFISVVTAAVIPFDGLRQQNATTNVINETEKPLDTTTLNDEGYKYKSVRRLKYRVRRDVSHLDNDYLPPSEEISQDEKLDNVSEVVNEYLPPAEEVTTEAGSGMQFEEHLEDSANAYLLPAYEEKLENSAFLGENGYEYKTIRRLKYRQRRDVSAAANEYLPPAEEITTKAVVEVKSVEKPKDSAVLGENGYEYKTVRRLKYRQLRDVSEIANEYLPPTDEPTTETITEVNSDEQAENSAVLGENGYEYKTVRRFKYRQRRDVSEIANEFLPPAEDATTEAVAEIKSVEKPEDSAVLGENENEVKSVEEPEDSAVLGENGYEYKTVRRLKYRQRRDVSEIANEYLPPTEDATTEAVAEVKSIENPEDSAVLGENGYEYKTVRRLKYRQRRGVSEIASEYLPPTDEATIAAVTEVNSNEQAENSAVLGENGYEYKTVRRFKNRQRRDVSEITNEYLPPAEDATTEAVAEIKSVEKPEDSAVLGENENEVKSVEKPEDSAILGENGYEYKTVRRLKYRQRRNVSEIANEYLPPTEDSTTEGVAEVKSIEKPEDSAVLGENGYEYKTVRRLKYRQRRDVSEIANEYLPPTDEATTEAVTEVNSDEQAGKSAVLADNGYEYKTVRRLKYRQRRDVSEIANEYLPPNGEGTSEIATMINSSDEPKDSAVSRENGYEYKTVHRLKYRQ